MWYSFTLAGWRLWCSAPFDLTVGQESRPFLLEVQETPPSPGEADRVLELCPVESLPFSAQDGGMWQDNRCYRRQGQVQEVFYCAAPGRPPYAQVTWDLSAPQRLLCRYVAGQEGELYTFRNIFQLLSGETLLLELGGLMLHASFIRWQGQGILFSAPSGVGKSTQANLWAQCCQAEVLNGDRAALRPGPDGWSAYGLPYAGSSGIYRNEHAPVAAIVLLGQAKENSIRRVSPAQALCALFPEVSKQGWDPLWTDRAVELLTQLVTQVPVYRLECLPDPSAVDCLKAALQRQSSNKGGEQP